jgi:predicted DNA-binding transcriptional regulator AlpA
MHEEKFINWRIQMTTTLEYISKNELANSLGISISTIDRKLNEICHVKMGKSRQSRVLFSVEKIKQYLESHTFEPQDVEQ